MDGENLARHGHSDLGKKQEKMAVNLEHPQVSVILPVYNRRHLIQRALDSIKRQTFTDYELLIVDDGSEDDLEEVVLPQVLQRAGWRYLKHAHRGLPRTRNIGIQAALGEFVTFLDSDDEYLPDHLLLRVEFFRKHPEVDAVHGGVKLVGPEELHWVVDADHPDRKIHIRDCVVGATIFGKRDVLLEAGGFPVVPYSSESRLMAGLEKRAAVRKVEFPTYVYHTEPPDRLCRKREQAQDETGK